MTPGGYLGDIFLRHKYYYLYGVSDNASTTLENFVARLSTLEKSLQFSVSVARIKRNFQSAILELCKDGPCGRSRATGFTGIVA